MRRRRSHRHLLHDDVKCIEKSINTYLSFVSRPCCKAVRKASAVFGLLMVAKHAEQFQGRRQQESL